jgi:hypothetical protein
VSASVLRVSRQEQVGPPNTTSIHLKADRKWAGEDGVLHSSAKHLLVKLLPYGSQSQGVKRHISFWILDFGFWISEEKSTIQNPKSKIQNHKRGVCKKNSIAQGARQS